MCFLFLFVFYCWVCYLYFNSGLSLHNICHFSFLSFFLLLFCIYVFINCRYHVKLFPTVKIWNQIVLSCKVIMIFNIILLLLILCEKNSLDCIFLRIQITTCVKEILFITRKLCFVQFLEEYTFHLYFHKTNSLNLLVNLFFLLKELI